MQVSLLNLTPRAQMVDADDRPYFLWDQDLSLDAFEARLVDNDPDIRSYFIGKLLRQTRPDDVFQFVSPQAIIDDWPRVRRHLGQSLGLWEWLLNTWVKNGYVHW